MSIIPPVGKNKTEDTVLRTKSHRRMVERNYIHSLILFGDIKKKHSTLIVIFFENHFNNN